MKGEKQDCKTEPGNCPANCDGNLDANKPDSDDDASAAYNCYKMKTPKRSSLRRRPRGSPERMQWLSRPTARRLKSLWDENCEVLPPKKRDNVKRALEEEYFMSPEMTEEYFAAVRVSRAAEHKRLSHQAAHQERLQRGKEMRQRQKWLVGFSAQVAYKLCEYVSKGERESLVSNRLRSIADVVLERVAEILGEPKPSRTNGSRLARFMVAVSDRIAVWIENSVYRAEEYADAPCPCPSTLLADAPSDQRVSANTS